MEAAGGPVISDQGVYVAAITPRGNHGDVDFGAVFELIDFLCAASIRGIVFFGPSGEYPALSVDERARLLYLAVKRSRIPVFAGVGSASLGASLALARQARDAGVAGLILPPPLFFRYQQDDLYEFYRQFAAQAGKGAVTYISNAPDFTTAIHVDTALRLLETGGFAGIEEASGNLATLARLQSAASNGLPFTLLSGCDATFAPARCAGAHGAISPAACAVPELFMALDSAIRGGDRDGAARLDAMLHSLLDWFDKFPHLTALKVAATLRGLKTGPLSVPLTAEKQKRLDQFREWFQTWLCEMKKLSQM
jgi:dihydrodipicolinate synthase/N-acetylneuraminate lyase